MRKPRQRAATESERDNAFDRLLITRAAVALAHSMKPDDPRKERARAAELAATEAFRSATERDERALSRLTSLRVQAQHRRAQGELRESQERSRVWQVAEQSKRDKAIRDATEKREKAIASVLRGEG